MTIVIIVLAIFVDYSYRLMIIEQNIGITYWEFFDAMVLVYSETQNRHRIQKIEYLLEVHQNDL